MADTVYPVTVKGECTHPPGRGWWLLKWLLAIPHYIILSFLWIAFVVVLFTGKYPRDIFNLVVGMNRWAYRVGAYASLMTDRYPPFRLWDD